MMPYGTEEMLKRKELINLQSYIDMTTPTPTPTPDQDRGVMEVVAYVLKDRREEHHDGTGSDQ